jgi:hypothetical protein
VRRQQYGESAAIARATGNDRDVRIEINLFAVARLLIRKRRFMAAMVFGVIAVTATYLFLQPNLYTSEATILPTGKSTPGVSALKSLVGLAASLPSSDENSSALFPVVLRSNLIVDAILNRQYLFREGAVSRSLNLSEYFSQDNPDRLRKNLRDITTVRSDKQTGEIYVRVETANPGLSRAVLTGTCTVGRFQFEQTAFVGQKRRRISPAADCAGRAKASGRRSTGDVPDVEHGWANTTSGNSQGGAPSSTSRSQIITYAMLLGARK